MEKVFFNLENCSKRRTGEPTIRINRNSGLVAVTKAAIQKTGLKTGNYIEFYCENKNLYLIEARDIKKGFKLCGKEEKYLSVTNVILTERIVAVFATLENFSLKIGEQTLIEHQRAWLLTKPD